MKEYISREDALKTLCKYCDQEPNGPLPCTGCHPPCADYEDFKTIPAADVAPVVHGRWIDCENDKWECSECGRIMWFSPRLDVKPSDYRFCPNCGAKMDVDGGTQDAVDRR